MQPRPHAFDLTNHSTSVVVCASQYYSGLATGRPPMMRGLWASGGALSFPEWLNNTSNIEHITTVRRTLVNLSAGNHRRHGHFLRFPLRMISLVDGRNPPSSAVALIEDRNKFTVPCRRLRYDIGPTLHGRFPEEVATRAHRAWAGELRRGGSQEEAMHRAADAYTVYSTNRIKTDR